MKKIALYLIATIATLALAAQGNGTMSIRYGSKVKKFDYQMAHSCRIAAERNGELYMVTQSTKKILGNPIPTGLQLVVTDTNLNVLRTLQIADKMIWEAQAVNYVDGKVYVLCHMGPLYMRQEIDPISMTKVKEERVALFEGGENDNFYDFVSQSENRDFCALVGVTVSNTANEYNQKQYLLDDKFNILWEKKYDASLLTGVVVTDEGVVYTMGSHYNPTTQETSFIVSELDVDKERTMVESKHMGMVDYTVPLNAKNGIVVGAGYIKSPKSKKNDLYDSYFGVAFNTRTQQLSTSVQPITSDELNVLGNKNNNRTNSEGVADALIVSAKQKTQFGGVLVLQRSWSVTRCNNKTGCTTTVYVMGTLAFGVDTTGAIVWHKPFRTNTQSGQDNFINIQTASIGDNFYLIQPEHKRAPETYDISKATWLVPIYRKHADALYKVDKDGNVEKLLGLSKEKGSMMGRLHKRDNGKYYAIRCTMTKSLMCYVEL